MENLPPIPTPTAQRWREFRVQILPTIIFCLALGASAMLWRNYVAPAALVGQVEAYSANVMTTTDGLLTDLTVDRFAEVTAGQPIAQVSSVPPEVLEAELSAIEYDLRVVDARMKMNEVATLDTGTQLRLNLMTQQTELALERIRLAEAENVFKRVETLARSNINTQAQLDAARTSRDTLQAEVTERGKLVTEFEKQLAILQPMATNALMVQAIAIEQDILKQQERLRQLSKPLVLRAPIDGRVSAILKRAGERVTSGTPIVTITPNKAERVIAWVRQPMIYRPKVGDSVVIKTRSPRRLSASAQVMKVGSQLESIASALLPTDKPRPEQGLPISVSLPPELGLLPGEWVDIQLVKR